MSKKKKQNKSDVSVNDSGCHGKQREDTVSIDALSWAAERAGLSYGRFLLSLSPEGQERVQAEYEKWKKERAKECTRRSAVRPDYPSNPFSAGILTDKDI